MSHAGRVRLFGLPLDPLTMGDTLTAIEQRMADGSPGSHVSLNAANVVTARGDVTYERDLEASDFVSPDGQSVVWAGRLLGLRIPERVTGIDLMLELASRAAERGWSVYLVGARPAVAAEVARRLKAQGVRVLGHRDGYFSPEEDQGVAMTVAASGADLLFVAMPSPRKERFIIGAARPAGVPFSIGVGGAFDVISGRVRRAPRMAQRLGLEWAYRLAQEPRRLMWRYATNNTRFLSLLGRELLSGARRRGRR